ncbi:hypothetical protein FAI41_01110 [Acetobacteraceae bacterium]|nr:hypothetical protein FAI41_01110 [Acetobacteraceae bacterium]
MFFLSRYRQRSIKSHIFSLAVTALCIPSLSTMAYADKANDSAKLSATPNSSNAASAKKIQTEAYNYQHQSTLNAPVSSIEIQNAVLKKSSNDLIEGSFILKNKANKDFLLKSISAEKCQSVGQFQDNQASIEATEETSNAAVNIFKNLPIAHLNTISFPFNSFHLACVPKKDSTFEEGTTIPFIFHFQEGDQTYNFTVQNNNAEG